MKSFVGIITFANLVTFLSAVDCSESISPADYTTTTVRPAYWQSSSSYHNKQNQPGGNIAVNFHTKITPPNVQPIVTFTTQNNRNAGTPGHVKVTVNHEEQSHHQVNYNYEKKVYPSIQETEEDVVAAGNFPSPQVQVPVTSFSHSSITNFQTGFQQPEYSLKEVLKNYPRCTYRETDNIKFSWDSSPYFNGDIERFYVPLTYKKAYNKLYSDTTGEVLRVGENLNDVCYILDTNWQNLTTKVWTHGTVRGLMDCRFLDNNVAMECVPRNPAGSPFLFFWTKTDNRTYSVKTYCWRNEEPQWIVTSNKKSLSYSLKQEILYHVQSLGFSRSDYSEANYDNCGDVDTIPGIFNAADIILDHTHTHSHSKPIIPIRQITSFQTQSQSHNRPEPKPYNYITANYPGCVPPKNVYDFTWNSAAYVNKGVETFYIPLAYHKAVNNYHKTVSGQVLRDTQNVNDVCLTIDVNWKDVSAVVTTFGGQNVENFQCKFPIENKFIIECVSQEKQNETFIAFATKSDDKTYFVAFECWKDGEIDWTVYSNNKYVPYTLKQEVLTHVQELGFSQSDYVEPSYTNCARRPSYAPNPYDHVKVSINHKEHSHHQVNYNYEKKVYPSIKETEEDVVSSGNIPSPQVQVPVTSFTHSSLTSFQTGVQQPEYSLNEVLKKYPRCNYRNNINFSWDSSSYYNGEVERFYMPLTYKKANNKLYIETTGEILRGSENTNELCYILDTNWQNLTTKVYAHGKVRGILDCRFLDNNVAMECIPRNPGGSPFVFFWTKTDNRTYSVKTYCWKNAEPQWIVTSNKKSLPYSLKQEILSHVQSLGFSRYDYSESNYDNCGDVDTPVVHFADTILEHKHSHSKPVVPIRQVTNFQTQSYYQPKPYNYVTENYPSCVPPKNVYDLTWNSAAYVSKGVETFYIPLAYHKAVNNYHKTVSGQVLRDTQNVNDVCLTIDVNWKDISAVVSTFGGQNVENFQCKFPIENKFIIECVSQEKQNETFIAFATKTDDKTYFVAYECWRDGQVDWTVYSNNKYVPYTLKQEVLTHVQELGFSQTDYVEPSYSNCARRASYTPNPFVQHQTGFSQVHGQQSRPFNVHSQSQFFQKPVTPVQQHQFIKPKLESCQLPYSKRITWNSEEYKNQLSETFYVPMAHKDAYVNYVKLASRKLLRSSDIMNDVCLRSAYNYYDQSMLYVAYEIHESPVIKCGYERKDFWSWRCEEENGKFVQSTVTKSDDKSYFVVYNCHENGPTWAVFYKYHTKLPENIKYDILDHLQSLGFSTTDYKELNYANCAYESEVADGSAVALFPNCNPPEHLQTRTWESSSFFENIEYFEVALADRKVPELYNKILNRRFSYSSYRDSKSSCYRWRLNYNDNTTNLIGFNDNISYDYKIQQNSFDGWKTLHLPKDRTVMKFSDYIVKSDNVGWLLAVQCWETGDNTWIVYTKPGTKLNDNVKNGILKTVQDLGFNSRNYQEFDYDNCKFNNRLFFNSFDKKSCDCLY